MDQIFRSKAPTVYTSGEVGLDRPHDKIPARLLSMAQQCKAEIFCALLLLVMAVNLLTAIARKSITNDEIVHIPAGYYHLVAGYFQINNEHPPLAKMWAALPLLFIQPNEVPPDFSEARANSSQRMWAYREQFWPINREHFGAICFWTRAMMVPITLLLGWVIFRFSRDLFGTTAALFAVGLYALEPTVLAHGRVVHTDVPAALVYLLFFVVLRGYFRDRTIGRALLLALAAGVALVTKFSMIILLPVLGCLAIGAILFAPRLQEKRATFVLHTVVAACVVLFVVNAAYRFHSPPVEPDDVRWVQTRSGADAEAWMNFFHAGSKVLPTYYLFGAYNVMVHNREGHAASLLGQYRNEGWWYYFPVAFALKTSVPFLLLTLAALPWSVWRWLRKDKRFAWLLLPFLLYAAFSMTAHINIGVRHFLPAYPFLFITGGAFLAWLIQSPRVRVFAASTVILLCSWICVEAFRTYPDYTPYLNKLAAAHPHWWYLADSNVEWGDDVLGLADYLHAHGENEVRGLVAGGWGTLAQYGIKYHEIFPRPGVTIPSTRYLALGASVLNGATVSVPPDAHGHFVSDEARVNYFDAYRTRVPEAIIGGSIYVFRDQ